MNPRLIETSAMRENQCVRPQCELLARDLRDLHGPAQFLDVSAAR